MTLNIRLRSGSKGMQHLKLSADATLEELQGTIQKMTDVPPNQQKVLVGFPPREITASPSESLAKLGIVNSDTITLELKPASTSTASSASTASTSAPPAEKSASAVSMPTRDVDITPVGMISEDGSMVRRVVDSDNSCLFNSIGYVLENKDRRVSDKLRKVIAQAVRADEETYNDAFLGKSNKEYINWITNSDSWGGAIELSILSQYYKCEIAAFDIKTLKMYVYGEGQNYKQRVFLIYDGIHYDAMAYTFDPAAPEDIDVTIFSPQDPFAVAKGLELAEEAKKKRQFTDTANFDLRCLVCQQGLVGQKEAVEHAKKTSHTNFSEYK